eukprot:Hpha_TRINITY_DN16610_c1_g1::TRINITY_DN16610_c1_g1_i2::g.179888::m.179888
MACGLLFNQDLRNDFFLLSQNCISFLLNLIESWPRNPVSLGPFVQARPPKLCCLAVFLLHLAFPLSLPHVDPPRLHHRLIRFILVRDCLTQLLAEPLELRHSLRFLLLQCFPLLTVLLPCDVPGAAFRPELPVLCITFLTRFSSLLSFSARSDSSLLADISRRRRCLELPRSIVASSNRVARPGELLSATDITATTKIKTALTAILSLPW